MMFAAVGFGLLAWQTAPPKITYQDGGFLVVGALGEEIVPIARASSDTGPVNRKKGEFRLTLGSKTVVFNSKGLTIAQKPKPFFTTLNGVPTSGKISTKETNETLMKLVATGERSLAVSALSGWMLVGHRLYLVPRWVDKAKKPWLEAVVAIDFDEKVAQPMLLGKVEGLSTAEGVVDDVVLKMGGALAVLANSGESFGLAKFDPGTKTGTFDKWGAAVHKARVFEGGTRAWTLKATPYGTNILGTADLSNGSYSVGGEIRGKMLRITEPGLAKYQTTKTTMLLNLMTGAETHVAADGESVQVTNGILSWSPTKNPKSAVLYDANFRRLASWSAPKPAPAPVLVTKPKPAPKKPAPKIEKQPKKPAAKPKAKRKPKGLQIEVTSKPTRKKR